MSEKEFPSGATKITELLAEKHKFSAEKKLRPEKFFSLKDVKRESL